MKKRVQPPARSHRRALIAALVLALLASIAVALAATTNRAPLFLRAVARGLAAPDLGPFRAAMLPEFAADVDTQHDAPQYRIVITVSHDLTTLTGRETVRYTNRAQKALDEVVFRLFPNLSRFGGHMDVSSVLAAGAPVTAQLAPDGFALHVPLPAPLQPGDSVQLALDYAVSVPTSAPQAGYSEFGLFDGVLQVPEAYPLLAVYDADGWHASPPPGVGDATFNESALYQVTITAPPDQVLAASGTCTLTQPEARTWECATGPARDFAIVLSSNFDVISADAGGVSVHSYFLKADADAGQAALEYAQHALADFGQRIAPYPYRDFSVVEGVSRLSGMEYPGLVIVDAGAYGADKQEFLTAHEVAHQWFYNLVGSDQTQEPWLDEALVEYLSVLYIGDQHGDSAAQNLIQRTLVHRDQALKNSGQDAPANLPSVTYAPGQYTEVIYGKAPLFYDALYRQVGNQRFNDFLSEYLGAHRYGIAHQDDVLRAAYGESDSKTVDRLFQQWITSAPSGPETP